MKPTIEERNCADYSTETRLQHNSGPRSHSSQPKRNHEVRLSASSRDLRRGESELPFSDSIARDHVEFKKERFHHTPISRRCILEVAVAKHRHPLSSSHWVACSLRVAGRPWSSWSPLFGGRQSAALLDWTFCGAQRLGKTATLVPSRWSFARMHMLDTWSVESAIAGA